MENMAGMLVALLVGGFALFAGMGFLFGAGGGGNKEGGTNAGKVVTIIVVGLFLAMWLSMPGTDKQISGTLTTAGGNLSRGMKPLVDLLMQTLGMAIVVGIVILGGYIALKVIKNRPPPRRDPPPRPRRFWE